MKTVYKILLIFIFSFLLANNLFAAKCVCTNGNSYDAYSASDCSSGCTFQSDSTSAGTVSLTNPLGTGAENTSIPTLLGKVISSILGVVGSLALVMFIYGGITWMISAGNTEQVTKGKNILIWATVGIVIIFTAYALVRFVLTTVTGAGT